jgi:hypothetical protein
MRCAIAPSRTPAGFLPKEKLIGKPNFSFQKRQKELAKKKKSEEKQQRKLGKNPIRPVEDQQGPPDAGADRSDGSKDEGQ